MESNNELIVRKMWDPKGVVIGPQQFSSPRV
jgi:hypothetical protein